jgi:hypothetical protein
MILITLTMCSQYLCIRIAAQNPLCRVAPLYDNRENNGRANYDKEKYREMILDAAETVLGYFGFDRTLYGDKKKYQNANGGGWKN